MFVSEYPKGLLKLFTYCLPLSELEDIVLHHMKELKHLEEYSQFENRCKFLNESAIPRHIESELSIFSIWWSKEEKDDKDS
jgi:hypothetical protein